MSQEKQVASKHTHFELFLVSFLVLFFELACIRWFAAYVVFLTFFTNIILLASFLGMSVGCLAAPRKTNFVKMVPLLSLLAIFSAVTTLAIYESHTGISVDVGNQASPQQIYFGTEYRNPDLSQVVIPMELIAGCFFLLVALIFVGIGQIMGRRFDMIPNRVLAYTTNICGSLAGIVAFAVISLLWLPPLVWFGIAFACVAYFLIRETDRRAARAWHRIATMANICCLVVTIVCVGIVGSGTGVRLVAGFFPENIRGSFMHEEYDWSPYYWIAYTSDNQIISTNNIGHQQMRAAGSEGVAYALPYLLSRDSQRPPIKDVLVIGAGSGNDVANALWAGVEHVDAVEIDPIIYDLGRRLHPDHPYQDQRVHIHLNDGRNFLKETDRKYDLIVYALLDSLILHSGYSNLRLENYLFTKQAIADVKARLKDGGIFVMYNYFRQEWLVGRLQQMVREVFNSEPIVISLPYRSRIEHSEVPSGQLYFTMIIAGDTAALKEKFKNNGAYWIKTTNFLTGPDTTAFGFIPPQTLGPAKGLSKIGPATVEESKAAEIVPNDNWPFLYLQGRLLPDLTVRGMVVVGVLALVLLVLFAPKKAIRFNWTMFFLGAGFMLLETKSVVHLALLFGSTWIVNSIVFFAILIMILLANLYVLRARPRRLTFFYAALVLSLVVNIFFSLDAFLGLPEIMRIVGPCLIVFIPIFFAGVIFSTFFRESTNPDMDMGSNIAGVVLGGLAENFSMVLGFSHLLWVAIGFYLLSRLLKGRVSPRPAV
jgi:hypothetical protein